MSKKDLLERISRAPTDGRGVKRTETAPTVAGEAVTTRVSGRVVRRRARNEPEPEEVVPTVVRRRTVEPPPTEVLRTAQAEEAAPADVDHVEEHAHERHVEVAPPEPVHEYVAPEPEPEPEPVRAAEPEPVREPERPVEPEVRAEPTAEPVPVAAQRTPVRPPEPQPIAAKPERAPAEPAEAEGVPERPRFEGLGRAVVMPPPGYDPTNPQAYRRRVEQRGPPPGARQPAAPVQPAQPAFDDFGRRRRVETEGGGGDAGDDRRRQRRGRAAASVGGDGMAMRRRPRRKPGLGVSKPSPGPKASKRRIRIDNVISVGQLAHELGVKAAVVIKELMKLGRMSTVNEMLDLDTAQLVATEFEYEVVNAGFQEQDILQHVAVEEEEGQETRPPVVTIMGHVDHGKTTLLDAIRAAKVAAGEAGGITQHIGAYQVELEDQKITFIDTPGHAAFTSMRARGASITDIVVLVVAADDGVQAQTEEAIAHARAADVPIVVAVNKMDKPGVNPDNIKNKLSELGLQPEDWGGDTMYAHVSALKKTGIDDLLEAILLQSEVLELRANPDRPAEGVVIEARVERGRGNVATLLVQRGTLRRGDNIVLGSTYGRIRAMMDDQGKQLKEAPPSTPVEVFGLNELPETGDVFNVVKAEKDARTLAEHRGLEKRQAAMAQTGRRTAADIFAQAEAAQREVLPLILKADVQGSLEALRNALVNIDVKGTELRLLHTAVGDISESDVNLAAANGALLIGFNVRVDSMARQAADGQGVTAELYDVIYGVLDRVTARMKGLLAPETREVRMGEAEVRAVFSISKIGKIAGCYVQDGKIGRNHGARVIREGQKVWEGRIGTLKRFKDDVREVLSGYECGIGLDGFDGIQVGDTIETFSQEEVKS